MKDTLRNITVSAALLMILAAVPGWSRGERHQDDGEIHARVLSSLRDGGAAGTEFYFSLPPCYEVSGGGNAIQLFIASATRTRVLIEVEGRGFRTIRFTQPYQVLGVELAPGVAQPYSKSPMGSSPPDQIWPGAAIHVKAGAPVVVYGVTRFDYTSDACLIYPANVLGKEYIVASMADMTWMYPGYVLPSQFTVSAPYDNTRVTVKIGGTAPTVTASGLRPGQTRSWTLNRGDVLVVSTRDDSKEGDLSGTLVTATKPVAVLSGNQCANVPTDMRWCDFISDMEIPTDMWGKVVLVPRVITRRFAPMVKIFAKEPNTRVFRNGSFWRTISSKGGMEGVGYIYDRSSPDANNEVVVLSGDKPLGVTFFNPGQEDDGVVSDPFQMTIYPLEQYQREFIFSTPGGGGLKSFSQNYLIIVFPLTDVGTMPPDLEWGQAVGGQTVWRPVSVLFGPAVGDVFPMTINGRRYAAKTLKIPDGVYRLRCSTPVAAYSYGLDNYDSYGTPTSASFNVQLPDTVPPVPRYEVNCDGSVTGVGGGDPDVTDMPNDPTIRSNLALIYLDPESSRNYTLDYDPFIPGESVSTKWRLTVDDPDQDAIAHVIFRDRAGNDTVIIVEYKARRITIQPADVDFGLVRRGTLHTKTVDVVNEGTSTVRVTRLELKNGGVGVFEIVNNPIPFDLQPNERKTITIRYTANNDGVARDSIGVGDDCVFRYRRLIAGQTGEPIIDVSNPVARPLDFGDVTVGQTAQRTFTVFSRGTVQLTITNAQGPSNPSFIGEAALGQISPVAPLVLSEQGGANDRKSFTVSFAPTLEQPYTATITFSSDANRIDSVVHLKGRGVKPGLSVTPIDFGEKRINREYNLLDDWMTIAALDPSNTGTQAVTITDVSVDQVIRGDGNSYRFVPELNQITAIDIPPGQSYSQVTGSPILVYFRPQQVGPHEITVRFENSTGENRYARITGTGVAPRVSITPTVVFGPIEAGSNPDVKQVTVTNLSRQDWQYADTLTLTDLQPVVPGTISSQIGVYGTEGFTFDRPSLNLPRTLLPGQSIMFTAEYFTTTPGNNSATLSTVSDALEEAQSAWTGSAYSGIARIQVANANGEICVGSTTILNVVVTNTGDVPVTQLDFVRIGGPNATMFGAPRNLPLPNPIPRGGTYTLEVPFTPSGVGTFSATIVLRINGIPDQDYTATLTGTGLQETTTISLTSEVFDIPQGSSSAPKEIYVVSKAPVSRGSVTVVKLRIRVDARAFSPVVNNGIPVVRVLGPLANAGWVIASATVQYGSDFNTIEVQLNGTTPMRLQGGEQLLGVQLTGSLPSAIPTAGGYVVELAVIEVNDQCVVYNTEGTILRINPVCAFNLRFVKLSLERFGIHHVNPNPVSASGAEIHFGIGYDAPTVLEIVSTTGTKVATLVSGDLKAGQYAVQFIPNGIASGAYLLRMESGAYSETVPLVIVK